MYVWNGVSLATSSRQNFLTCSRALLPRKLDHLHGEPRGAAIHLTLLILHMKYTAKLVFFLLFFITTTNTTTITSATSTTMTTSLFFFLSYQICLVILSFYTLLSMHVCFPPLIYFSLSVLPLRLSSFCPFSLSLLFPFPLSSSSPNPPFRPH